MNGTVERENMVSCRCDDKENRAWNSLLFYLKNLMGAKTAIDNFIWAD